MATIDGTSGNDNLVGTSGNDKIYGLGGDDILEGGRGNDYLDGGAGYNTADYSDANGGVTVNLATGTATGADGSDTLVNIQAAVGSAYNDVLYSTTGSTLDGGGGDDTFIVNGDDVTVTDEGAGSDTFTVNGANANITVGDGSNDTFLINGSAFINAGTGGSEYFSFEPGSSGTIDSFQSQIDTIDLSAIDIIDLTLSSGSTGATINYTTSAGQFTITEYGGPLALSDLNLSTIPNLTLYGTANEPLSGESGNDTLYASSGEVITGGAGADTFAFIGPINTPDTIADFQTGVDKIQLAPFPGLTEGIVGVTVDYSGTGTDISVSYFLAADEPPLTSLEIKSQDFIATSDLNIIGSNGPLTLIGSSSYDQLLGGAGNDTIIGGGGGDNLTGGAGADTFKYLAASDSTASSYDIITDFQHTMDKIDLTAVAPTYISLVHYEGATYLFPTTPTGNMEIAAVGDVEGNDLITGAPVNLYLVADDNGDTLIAGSANDSLHGGAGNDILFGLGGADALYGGAGSDTFKYEAPSDSNPQAYDIIQDFQTGTDKLDLADMTPTNVSIVHYNGGTFVSGLGTDDGSGGTPSVFQIGSVHDINAPDIMGLTSGAYIVGDNLGDTLIGGNFAETIVGGSGNDVIIGGGGADALYGGAGADTFKYLAASDSTVSAPDIIQDFQTGVDKIDLTAVHTSSHDSYGLTYANGGAYLFVDQGGDGVNDMLIEIANATVHTTDLLW